MRGQGALDLGGANAVTAHVDHVVNAARDPDVPVLVAPRAVSGEEVVPERAKVRGLVAAMIIV